ncbi:MAG: DUF2066 domain-containing protein [Pseudomonadota bacterium]
MNGFKCSKISLLFVFLLFSQFLGQTTLWAGDVANLYEARVLVQNEEQKNNRQLLLNRVFVKVLHKISGSKDFLKLPDATKFISKSELLVQKFAFQTESKSNAIKQQETIKQVPSTAATTDNKSANTEDNNKKEETKTWFWARFNKQATDQLLKENKLAVWGHLRPDTLIWLSIENPPQSLQQQNQRTGNKKTKRQIISSTNYPSITHLLNSTADKRGILLLFPFGDLQDQNKLSMSDLWGNYSQAIAAASTRYHAQATLAVRIYQEPSGLWIANWSLYVLDKAKNWQSKNENIATLLSLGIHSLADKLAALFALQADTLSNKNIILQINNVTDFSAYQRVVSYFKRITAIQTYSLIQVKGDSLSYRIHYIGDEKHLIQSLELGEVLQKVENSQEFFNQEEINQPSEYVPVLLDVETKKHPQQKSQQQQLDKSPLVKPPAASLNEQKQKTIEADVEFWLAR